MLDIPEFEGFDKAICSHSWLDEVTGEFMAWARSEYDDFRRKHPDCKLPTSTEALGYFKLPCNRAGWAELMYRRFNLSIPKPYNDTFSERAKTRSGKSGTRDDVDQDMERTLGDVLALAVNTEILGWEDVVHEIVDLGLGDEAIDQLIESMQSSTLFV